VAGTAVRLVRHRLAPRGGAPLRSLLSWWFLAVAFTAAFLAGRTGILVLFAGVSVLGLREYLRRVPVRSVDRGAVVVAWLSLPAVYAALAAGRLLPWAAATPVLVVLLLASMVATGKAEDFLRAAGTYLLGIVLLASLLSHAPALVLLPGPPNATAGPEGRLLFLLALTEGSDVAQALTGRAIGRRWFAPELSPGKTVAGLAGGLALCLAAGVLLSAVLLDLSGAAAAGAILLIFVAGVFGDLTLSAVKRDLGVKDAGRTLPGQGGILDRVDSLVLTAPVFYWYVRLVAP